MMALRSWLMCCEGIPYSDNLKNNLRCLTQPKFLINSNPGNESLWICILYSNLNIIHTSWLYGSVSMFAFIFLEETNNH